MPSLWDLILGVAASTLSWLAIARSLTPRLDVSPLSRLPSSDEPCGYRYRIKIVNRSWLWDAADVAIHARVVLRGLNSERPTNTTSLRIRIDDPFPVLTSRRHQVLPGDRSRVYGLHVHDLSGDGAERLSDSTKARLTSRTITAEELMQEGSGEGFIRLAVTASHARSGLRRTYAYRVTAGDIEEGEFESPNHTKIVPTAYRPTDDDLRESEVEAAEPD